MAQAAFAILHVSVACCPLASRARPQMRRSEVHSRKYCLTERGLGQIFLVMHSHDTLTMRAVEATNVSTINQLKYCLCACIIGNIVSQSVVSGKYFSHDALAWYRIYS